MAEMAGPSRTSAAGDDRIIVKLDMFAASSSASSSSSITPTTTVADEMDVVDANFKGNQDCYSMPW